MPERDSRITVLGSATRGAAEQDRRDPHVLSELICPSIYVVRPTAFNRLGIDRWVRNFQYIAYCASWDGTALTAGSH